METSAKFASMAKSRCGAELVPAALATLIMVAKPSRNIAASREGSTFIIDFWGSGGADAQLLGGFVHALALQIAEGNSRAVLLAEGGEGRVDARGGKFALLGGFRWVR